MNPEQPIRVMIVDDSAAVRGGLSRFMRTYPDLQLIATAQTGEQAVELCCQHRPDVVLMDLVMPGMGGVAAIRQIHQRCPTTRVIALTSFRENDLVSGALQAGALGYLLKNVTAADLDRAIQSAYAGKMTLSPEATEVLAQTLQHPDPVEEITVREREVLGWMIKGLNNAEIAEKLSISLGTTKFHIRNIFLKLRASSRTEAVSIALQKHLID